MQTILLKIMPPEYVKDMREQLAQGTHQDDYFIFEQALFDEINTRKTDEESRKKSGRINVFNNSSGEDDKVKRHADSIEYEEVEKWSEEWPCNICRLSAEEKQKMMSKTDTVDHAGCVEGHTFRESAPTCAKVDRRIPSHRSFPGPTLAQWNSCLSNPSKGKRQGKEERQRKRRKGRQRKGKGQVSGLGEYPPCGPPLGHMPHWDENSHPAELVTLCATVRNVTDEDEQGWKTVKGRKETNAPH